MKRLPCDIPGVWLQYSTLFVNEQESRGLKADTAHYTNAFTITEQHYHLFESHHVEQDIYMFDECERGSVRAILLKYVELESAFSFWF